MEWLAELSETQPVAWAIFVLMLVALTGLVLAKLKFKGVGIGITGVLFTGILAGHWGVRLDKEILAFVREFGLILFVFTIGLQLGPGFFASLRKQGLKLNMIAALVVMLGVFVTIGIAYLSGIDVIASLGLFSGATTNTPSLGATQQLLKGLGGPLADQAGLPALAYAVAYPGGIVGIISTLLLLRFMFRVNPKAKAEQASLQQRAVEPLERMNLVVENPNLENLSIADAPGRTGIVVSRIKRRDVSEVEAATEQTLLHRGDVILAVGTRKALEHFRVVVGRESDLNLTQIPGRLLSNRIVVTRKDVFGKTLDELGLDHYYGVAVTRVMRAEIEMTAVRELRLQFGDTLQVVGDEDAMTKVTTVLGNRIQALHETNFLPIFIGIALGVLAGSIPIAIPHVPVPVRLGMAGGPLILALILSRIGRIGPLVWYMPASANTAFRELGIVLFLACVGLKAGEKFFETAFASEGFHWLLAGLAITVIPIFIGGLVARYCFKLNFNTISGLLAGSMTDPPALDFAHAISGSNAPLVAYATVYPLAMLLRIFAVQIMVLVFCR